MELKSGFVEMSQDENVDVTGGNDILEILVRTAVGPGNYALINVATKVIYNDLKNCYEDGFYEEFNN